MIMRPHGSHFFTIQLSTGILMEKSEKGIHRYELRVCQTSQEVLWRSIQAEMVVTSSNFDINAHTSLT